MSETKRKLFVRDSEFRTTQNYILLGLESDVEDDKERYNFFKEISEKYMKTDQTLELGEYQQGFMDGDRTARAELDEHIIHLKREKDAAYAERNKILAVLSKMLPSHLARHPADDEEWEKGWYNILCIHFPDYCATWHIHDSELELFKHLSYGESHWDGTTTEWKYEKLGKYNNIELSSYLIAVEEVGARFNG